MINFLLDFSLSRAALMISCLCTIIAIIMVIIIINKGVWKGVWDFRLPLIIFVIGGIFCEIISFIPKCKDKEITIFFNELENKYNYNSVRTEFEKENAGIIFCSFYDFKNPTCKNYIQYFIAQRLTDKKESEEKEQAKIIEAEKKRTRKSE